MDIIIKNGRIIDGNSNPWFLADIGIKGKKIIKIGKLSNITADRIIDAKGMIVTPGFIDIHNHSDITLLINGKAESMIHQGVTTVLTCNCGSSPFPLFGEAMENAKLQYSSQFNLDIDWTSIDEYKAKLIQQGTSINIGLQVGHGTVRAAVMGYEDRTPTSEEMNEMKHHVIEAMESGCFGISTGLGYPPGFFAKTDEIIELCKIVANYGGIYSTHVRSGFPSNINEAIEIGEKALLPVQMSHIGSMTCGKYNWGNARSVTLNIINSARARGVDFTADIYPYIAWSSGLTLFIPQWAHKGGLSELLKRLNDPDIRKILKNELADNDWSQTILVWLSSELNKKFEGKTVQEVSEIKNMHPVDVLCDLIIEEKGQGFHVFFFGLENDIQTLIAHEAVMIGSDGLALSPIGVLGQGKNHPRSYSAFTRVIEKYVNSEVLSLSKAIHKMSGLPAWRLGIKNRGVIKPGAYADITIFDPLLVKEKSTWMDPYQFPEGIMYVLVNGIVTIDEGRHTGALAGKILNRL